MKKAFIFSKRQLVAFFCNFPFIFASIVPKKSNLWIFSSWFGNNFSDNPKAIFLKVLNDPTISAFWITKSLDIYKEMLSMGLPVAYAYSWLGIWLQLRAKIIVFTHSPQTDFCSFLISWQTFRVQSWHGSPIKKIGDDVNGTKKSKTRSYLSKILFPHRIDRCDLVLAMGSLDKTIFERVFNVKADRVVITGYARNDILVERMKCSGFSEPHHLLYMPTFRGTPETEFNLLDDHIFNAGRVNEMLQKFGAKLCIKLHPALKEDANLAAKLSLCNNIYIYSGGGDIHAEMHNYDALITDYSSVLFDYLLVNKPIYMLPIDIDIYLSNDRGMYYDYQDICPSEPQYKWLDLIKYIYENEYPISRHEDLRNRVHSYTDNASSARAIDEIKKYA